MLDTPAQVVGCLITYTDWWQPPTGSVLEVPRTRGRYEPARTFRPGFVEELDQRAELRRRVAFLEQVDRRILYLYYVENRRPRDISLAVGLSTRQCTRRRKAAVDFLVEVGQEHEVDRP